MSPSSLLVLLPAEGVLGAADDEGAGLLELLMGGTSTCWMPLRASIWALIFAAAAAAAAAGSAGVLDLVSDDGLRADLDRGLRLRRDSDSRSLATGERDLRSKREFLRGSGSVWSNRDLFRGASSDISQSPNRDG